MRPIVLIVPGLGDSGPEHWQSRWEADEPTWRRVRQADWKRPRCADWVRRLDEAVRSAGVPVVIVAHSLGCVAVGHWGRLGRRIQGSLLVAPTDVEASSSPKGPEGFAPIPLARHAFPSIVAASRDDPYVSLSRARFLAEAWGSAFVDVGSLGHINAESGIGRWEEGRALLASLLDSRT
jgi:uncharacterized protein